MGLTLPTTRPHGLPCVFIQTQEEAFPGCCLLFAHGNAIDLGLSIPQLSLLAHHLKINVFAFEYEGYGPTQNSVGPHVDLANEDLRIAYDHVVSSGLCKNPKEKLILYGQSLGTAVAATLIKEHKKRPIAGLVLHSPLASGVRLLLNNPRCFVLLDVFPNEKRVRRAKCPVFVIHGRMDTMIPVEHGERVHMAIPSKYRFEPYFVDFGGHNDISDTHEEEYFAKLLTFCRACLTSDQLEQQSEASLAAT